ncbi:uncharacterized protein LOC141902673 [Tubulanus polymorphus]|uniref:uncharacterized protein LOC141902673 n=1 Tax=Tubulanus polymorphus TaxID=672921 RepID=UPI003DA47B45
MVAMETLRNASLADAARTGDFEKAYKLLQKGSYCNINDCGKNSSGTALYWAAARGCFRLVRLLVSMQAIVDKQNCWGATALHAAADSGDVESARILIANGADVNKTTRNLDTACHLAANKGHLDVIKLLIEANANPSLRNSRGRDVMDDALINRKHDIVSYLHEYYSTSAGQKYVQQHQKDEIAQAVVTSRVFVTDSCAPKTSIRRRSFHEETECSIGKLVLLRQRSRSLIQERQNRL